MYIMSAYKIFVINLKALFKKKDPYWILHYSLPFQLTLEPCTPRPGPPVVVPTGQQTNTYVHMTDTSRGRSSLTHYNEYRL